MYLSSPAFPTGVQPAPLHQVISVLLSPPAQQPQTLTADPLPPEQKTLPSPGGKPHVLRKGRVRQARAEGQVEDDTLVTARASRTCPWSPFLSLRSRGCDLGPSQQKGSGCSRPSLCSSLGMRGSPAMAPSSQLLLTLGAVAVVPENVLATQSF